MSDCEVRQVGRIVLVRLCKLGLVDLAWSVGSVGSVLTTGLNGSALSSQIIRVNQAGLVERVGSSRSV